LALALLLSACAGSCKLDDEGSAAPRAPKPDVTNDGPGAEAATAPEPVAKRTTSGDSTIKNLNGRIAELERQLAEKPLSLELGEQAVELYGARSRFLGIFSDFEKMDAVSRELVSRFDEPKAFALRAAFLSSVHEFEGAIAELEVAVARGSEAARRALANIELAIGGDLEGALALLDERAQRYPTLQSLSDLGSAQAALGRFAEADQSYLAAAAAHRDVSPLPLAYLAFARGLMWAEAANRPDFARPLYEEAVERVPAFVVANVHLAEIEAAEGELDAAIARLKRVAAETEDPEPHGLLAELLLEREPATAAAHAETARSRYETLLARHRLAFADHGSEFFASAVGAEPARALELALENLEHRSTPRAYIVAIEAARAAERRDTACELGQSAEALAPQSFNLRVLLDELDGERACE
jgi:tetratricopeptide (TPR) repeat protein